MLLLLDLMESLSFGDLHQVLDTWFLGRLHSYFFALSLDLAQKDSDLVVAKVNLVLLDLFLLPLSHLHDFNYVSFQ
jgi:hypothetical protein